MKLTKKVTAMAMASCMILSMTACGGSKPAETTAAATEVATTEAAKEAETTAAEVKEAAGGDFSDKKVGISIYKFDDNFMTLYRTELERYLTEELGFKKENITIQDGKGDQAEQTNQIQNFIASGVDVMILNLVQASSALQVSRLFTSTVSRIPQRKRDGLLTASAQPMLVQMQDSPVPIRVKRSLRPLTRAISTAMAK